MEGQEVIVLSVAVRLPLLPPLARQIRAVAALALALLGCLAAAIRAVAEARENMSNF